VTDVAAHLALTGTNWLAQEPTTWDQGSDMSLLNALLLFFGGPLLIIAVVTLMVMAPSLAKGPRYRPGADAEDVAASEWFGVVPGSDDSSQVEGSHRAPQRQLATAATEERLTDDDTGGASARW
jgi:hypothetical protein